VDSGSGGVAVAPLDRGDQCSSNGTKLKVAVAILTEIRFLIVDKTLTQGEKKYWFVQKWPLQNPNFGQKTPKIRSKTPKFGQKWPFSYEKSRYFTLSELAIEQAALYFPVHPPNSPEIAAKSPQNAENHAKSADFTAISTQNHPKSAQNHSKSAQNTENAENSTQNAENCAENAENFTQNAENAENHAQNTSKSAPNTQIFAPNTPKSAQNPEICHEKAQKSPQNAPNWAIACAGGSAGLVAWMTLYPIDLIKTNFQVCGIFYDFF
jgi:hypothetical protein